MKLKNVLQITSILLMLVGVHASGESVSVKDTRFGAPAVNGIANVGSPALGDIAYDYAAGAFYGYGNGSSWVPLSGGADMALSNLASTAVNASIVPSADNAVDLGSSTYAWAKAYAHGVENPIPGSDLTIVTRTDAYESMATGSITISSGEKYTGDPNAFSGNVTVRTGNVVSTQNPGSLYLLTGSSGNGFKSGNIIISPGPTISSPTSRGKIQMQNGTEGTAGHVWTSTDTNGSGSWALAPYSAGTPSDWSGSAPTTVKDALDRLAALSKTLNGGSPVP
jgi:hypothetical protein